MEESKQCKNNQIFKNAYPIKKNVDDADLMQCRYCEQA